MLNAFSSQSKSSFIDLVQKKRFNAFAERSMVSISFIFRIASVSQWRSRIRFSFIFCFASFITKTKFNQKSFFFSIHSLFASKSTFCGPSFIRLNITRLLNVKSKKAQRQDEIEWKKWASTRKNGTWRWRGKIKEIKSYIKINGHQASAKQKKTVNCLCKRSAMNNFSLFSQRRNFAIHYYYYYHYWIDGHT